VVVCRRTSGLPKTTSCAHERSSQDNLLCTRAVFPRQPLVHTSEFDAVQLVRLLALSRTLANGHATNPTDNRTALGCSASPSPPPSVDHLHAVSFAHACACVVQTQRLGCHSEAFSKLPWLSRVQQWCAGCHLNKAWLGGACGAHQGAHGPSSLRECSV
jgi:hypothetical protein